MQRLSDLALSIVLGIMGDFFKNVFFYIRYFFIVPEE